MALFPPPRSTCSTRPSLLDFLTVDLPQPGWSPPLTALWWDSKGSWPRAHALVHSLETPDSMAVHAYLHRKQGAAWDADYWYSRAGRRFYRPSLRQEWDALFDHLVAA